MVKVESKRKKKHNKKHIEAEEFNICDKCPKCECEDRNKKKSSNS